MLIPELAAIVEAIRQISNGVKKVNEFTRDERKKYRKLIDESYILLDSAILLIINRLGDLLNEEEEHEFRDKLKELNNVTEWYDLERDVRLCKNLRYARCEMDRLLDKLKQYVSVSDPKTLNLLIYSIFEAEDKLANYIGQSLDNLASMHIEDYDIAKKEVQKIRDGLKEIRGKLITQQVEILKSI